jgi:hypothetical protein
MLNLSSVFPVVYASWKAYKARMLTGTEEGCLENGFLMPKINMSMTQNWLRPDTFDYLCEAGEDQGLSFPGNAPLLTWQQDAST